MRRTIGKDVDLADVSDVALLMEAVEHLGCNCGDWQCFSPADVVRIRRTALCLLAAQVTHTALVPSHAAAMTDFALAAELQETAIWLASTAVGPTPHLHRLQRAIAFLRGQRGPSIDREGLVHLCRNDPVVAAIYSLAYHDAADRLRGGAPV